jgi:predicted extracellular nuclease
MRTNVVHRNLTRYRSLLAITILSSLLLTLFFFEPVQARKSERVAVPGNLSTIFINEIHYDNTGTDTNEGVEIAGPAGTDLAGWSVVLYNGSGGAVYDTISLSGIIPAQQGGYGTLNFLRAGIQNGSPDGLALVNSSNALVQFLCYEGTFAATNGVASGQTCTDIGVAEDGTNAIDTSLQLQGSGTTYGNFTWSVPITQTRGSVNTGQTFTGAAGGAITLSINDITKAEGNSGTTIFTFTVTLSAPAPAGGVTFDIATQDNTATVAGDDYVSKSLTAQTIPQGATTFTFEVTVNGDTSTEPSETFFVNITNVTGTGVTVNDGQGTGTITNDDIVATPINQIQGSGTTSPLVGTSVTTTGIVTARISSGFFIQTPDANVDANSETSEGIFVFTSTPPPADAAVGNLVQVTATVTEFIPSQEPGSAPLTELTFAATSLLSTGNPLPAPIVLTAAETTNASETSNPLDTLEEYEGMRIQVNSLTVISPTGGNVNESNATATSNGLFFGVVTGVQRPFREPGIELNDPVPAPMPANVPRFDTNPERLRIVSTAQPGATIINVTTDATLTNLYGVLHYSFRTYTIFPDPSPAPTVSGNISAIPVPAPAATDLTVASFNLERFFDTVNDPGIGEPVLTQTAFDNRLNKASLAIRNILQTPDVLGVIELENLATLQALATKINADAVAANPANNPNYTAYLQEGNDIGGIDVGFLVKSSRITPVNSLCEDGSTRADCQFGKSTTFNNPDNSTSTLNDRPPLRLRATVLDSNNQPFAFTVFVNHLRSLNGVDSTEAGSNGYATEGERVRFKRRAQAEYLANLVQGCQTGDTTVCPGTTADERVILVGDFNAFQFNDGFVDSIGTIKGAPVPPDQVVLPSSDLVNPNLINLVDSLPSARVATNQAYSFLFDGNAQVLDHILITQNLQSRFKDIQFARFDADFPEIFRNDPNRPERISDHDAPVAYFSLLARRRRRSFNISGF